MIKYIKLIGLGFLFFSGCTYKEQGNSLGELLEVNNIIKFELDSLTPNSFQVIEILERNEITYFTFLNNINNTIYYYNFENQELVKTLKYEIGGDGLRNGIMSYNHHSNDSILLFGTGLYSYLTNEKGKVLKDFKLIDLKYQQSPYASMQSPVILTDGYIYYNSLVWGWYSSEYQPFMKYDLSSSQVNLFGGLPLTYQENGDWGSQNYDYAYQVFDKKNRKIIYSFPAANTLFEYGINKNEFTEIKDSYTFDEISPPFKDDNYVYDSEEWHFSMNNTEIYGSLLIDYEQSKVYRWYKLPVASSEKNPKRETLLLVYDYPNLKFLNSFRLPDFNYITENSFIQKNQIYVRIQNSIEDEIEFQSFKIF